MGNLVETAGGFRSPAGEGRSRSKLDQRRRLDVGCIAKRAFDILVSIVFLIVCAPLFAVLAALIKLDSRGPVFYCGKRVGKGGKLFAMYKFRTMRDAPVDTGPRVTACDDPRITRLGRVLRKTKLNEFPQFLNVLKGEMSLVGPRPEDPKYVPLYTPEQQRVLGVTPGITSVASILYRDEEEQMCQETLEETYVGVILPDKLRLDLEYVDHRSFLVDMDILFRTLLVLVPLFAEAAPEIEELLFGPVQRFVRRHLTWFILDLLLSAVAVFTACGAWWWAIHSLRPGWRIGIGSAVAMILTYTLMNQVWGLQRHSWSCASGQEVADIGLSAFCSTVVLTVFSMLGFGLSKKLILLGGFLAFGAFTVARYRSRLVTGLLRHWRSRRDKVCSDEEKRLLIVGTGPLAQFCARQVQYRLQGQHYRVVGFVDDDLRNRGIRVKWIEVLGSSRTLPALIAEHNIDMVVLAEPRLDHDRWQSVVESCQHLAVQFRVVPDLLGFVSATEQGSGEQPEEQLERAKA